MISSDVEIFLELKTQPSIVFCSSIQLSALIFFWDMMSFQARGSCCQCKYQLCLSCSEIPVLINVRQWEMVL